MKISRRVDKQTSLCMPIMQSYTWHTHMEALPFASPPSQTTTFHLSPGCTQVRYIIDFYFYDEKAGTPGAFEIVARPALDSFESALDRVKMNIYLRFAEWGLPCPITGTNGSVGATAMQQQQQQVSQQ